LFNVLRKYYYIPYLLSTPRAVDNQSGQASLFAMFTVATDWVLWLWRES